jgi:hypothetical protein
LPASCRQRHGGIICRFIHPVCIAFRQARHPVIALSIRSSVISFLVAQALFEVALIKRQTLLIECLVYITSLALAEKIGILLLKLLTQVELFLKSFAEPGSLPVPRS